MDRGQKKVGVSSFWNGLSIGAREASTYAMLGSAVCFFAASALNAPGSLIDTSARLAFSSAVTLALALGLEQLNPPPKKHSFDDHRRGRRAGAIASLALSTCLAVGLNMIQDKGPTQPHCNPSESGIGVVVGAGENTKFYYCP